MVDEINSIVLSFALQYSEEVVESGEVVETMYLVDLKFVGMRNLPSVLFSKIYASYCSPEEIIGSSAFFVRKIA